MSNLRPAKIRSAVRRRWFEHRLGALAVTNRGSPIHLGTAYGGWIVPAAVMRPGWTCYSVGAGGDVSFDAELIRRFDVRVRSVEPVPYFVDFVAKEMRNEPRFSVHRAAIAQRDGPIRMEHTNHPGARAVSAAGLFDTNRWYEFPGRSLPSLMAELGDDQIDILKMDTEGTEYELLPTLDLRALGIKILAVCLHHNGSVRQARNLIARLGSAGYEPVAVKPAVKITFVHQAVQTHVATGTKAQASRENDIAVGRFAGARSR